MLSSDGWQWFIMVHRWFINRFVDGWILAASRGFESVGTVRISGHPRMLIMIIASGAGIFADTSFNYHNLGYSRSRHFPHYGWLTHPLLSRWGWLVPKIANEGLVIIWWWQSFVVDVAIRPVRLLGIGTSWTTGCGLLWSDWLLLWLCFFFHVVLSIHGEYQLSILTVYGCTLDGRWWCLLQELTRRAGESPGRDLVGGICVMGGKLLATLRLATGSYIEPSTAMISPEKLAKLYHWCLGSQQK